MRIFFFIVYKCFSLIIVNKHCRYLLYFKYQFPSTTSKKCPAISSMLKTKALTIPLHAYNVFIKWIMTINLSSPFHSFSSQFLSNIFSQVNRWFVVAPIFHQRSHHCNLCPAHHLVIYAATYIYIWMCSFILAYKLLLPCHKSREHDPWTGRNVRCIEDNAQCIFFCLERVMCLRRFILYAKIGYVSGHYAKKRGEPEGDINNCTRINILKLKYWNTLFLRTQLKMWKNYDLDWNIWYQNMFFY